MEREAVARRVRPVVLQILDTHGPDGEAAMRALRYVAAHADCRCGARHVYHGSYWNYIG